MGRQPGIWMLLLLLGISIIQSTCFTIHSLDISEFFKRHAQVKVEDYEITHGQNIVTYKFPIFELARKFVQYESQIIKVIDQFKHNMNCSRYRLDYPSETERKLDNQPFLDSVYLKNGTSEFKCKIATDYFVDGLECENFIKTFAPYGDTAQIKPGKIYHINKDGEFYEYTEHLNDCSSMSSNSIAYSIAAPFFSEAQAVFKSILADYKRKIHLIDKLYSIETLPKLEVAKECKAGRGTTPYLPDFKLMNKIDIELLDYHRQVVALNEIYFPEKHDLPPPENLLTPFDECMNKLKDKLFPRGSEQGKYYMKTLKLIKESLIDKEIISKRSIRSKRSWGSFWAGFLDVASKDTTNEIEKVQNRIYVNEQNVLAEMHTIANRENTIYHNFRVLQNSFLKLHANERILVKHLNDTDKKDRYLMASLNLQHKASEMILQTQELQMYLGKLTNVFNTIFTDSSVDLIPSRILMSPSVKKGKQSIISVKSSVKHVIIEFAVPKNVIVKKVQYRMLPLFQKLENGSQIILECKFPEVIIRGNEYLPFGRKITLGNFEPLSNQPSTCIGQLAQSYIDPLYSRVTNCTCFKSDKKQDVITIHDKIILFSRELDEVNLICPNNVTRYYAEVGYTEIQYKDQCNITTRHKSFYLPFNNHFHVNTSHIIESRVMRKINLRFKSENIIDAVKMPLQEMKNVSFKPLLQFNNLVKKNGHVVDYIVWFLLIFMFIVIITLYCLAKRHKAPTMPIISFSGNSRTPKSSKSSRSSNNRISFLPRNVEMHSLGTDTTDLMDQRLDTPLVPKTEVNVYDYVNERSSTESTGEEEEAKVTKRIKRKNVIRRQKTEEKSSDYVNMEKRHSFTKHLDELFYIRFKLDRIFLCTVKDEIEYKYDNAIGGGAFIDILGGKSFIMTIPKEILREYFQFLNNHEDCEIGLIEGTWRLKSNPKIKYDTAARRWINERGKYVLGIRSPLNSDTIDSISLPSERLKYHVPDKAETGPSASEYVKSIKSITEGVERYDIKDNI